MYRFYFMAVAAKELIGNHSETADARKKHLSVVSGHAPTEQSSTIPARPLYPIVDLLHPPPPPPPEPAPFSLSAEDWEKYVRDRDKRLTAIFEFKKDKAQAEAADAYARDNDLRGVPFN